MDKPTDSGDCIHLNFGTKGVPIVGEDLKEIQRLQEFGNDGAIRLLNNNYLLPSIYTELQDKISQYEFRETDVFCVGYVKTGTTWLQELIWTMLHNCDKNNTDQDLYTPFERVPYFESSTLYKDSHKFRSGLVSRLSSYLQCDPEMEYMDMFKYLPEPRIYKCHFIPCLLNPKMLESSKIVYIIRNPTDTFLSFHHFSKTFFANPFRGNIEEFLQNFMKGLVRPGTIQDHIREWWPYRNKKNVYFIFYEDLKKSPFSEIKKLASFLGKDLTDQQIDNVIELTNFTKMQKNFQKIVSNLSSEQVSHFFSENQSDKRGGFFRKGESDGCKATLTKEMLDTLNEYFREEMKDLDLPYNF